MKNIYLRLLSIVFVTMLLASCLKEDKYNVSPNAKFQTGAMSFSDVCFPDFVQVSANNSFSLGLKEDGAVWAWGAGTSEGHLGRPEATPAPSPIPVNGLPNDIVKLYAGAYRSFAITSNGDVWAWGNNNSGALGIGSSVTSTHIPTKVNITNVVSITSESYNDGVTLFLKSDGYVWGCGSNTFGELGTGSTSGNLLTPVPSLLTSGVTSVVTCSNGYVSAAVKDGVVYTWGYNVDNLFGDGSATTSDIENISEHYLVATLRPTPTAIELTNIEKIDMGSSHALALSKNGDVYSWGSNLYGQLGLGSTGGSQPIPKKVGIAGVKDIEVSRENSWAVLSNGGIMAWGRNTHGVLGIGMPTLSIPIPLMSTISQDAEYITAGSTHTIAKKLDGTYWATGFPREWGMGSAETIGVNTFTMLSCKSEADDGAVFVATGSHNCFVKMNNGDVWVWGSCSSGQCGMESLDNYSSPKKSEILTRMNPIKIAPGASHTLFLLGDGTVWACGWNARGACGQPNGGTIMIPMKIDGLDDIDDIIAGNWYFSVAIKKDGTIFTWGGNEYGVLGIGQDFPQFVETHIPQRVILEDKVVSAKVGGDAINVLLENGRVYSWGNNSYGQLGIGTIGGYKNSPVEAIGLGNDVVKLLGGGTGSKGGARNSNNTFVVKSDNSIWTWGTNLDNSVHGSGIFGHQHTPYQSTTMPDPSIISKVDYGIENIFIIQKDGSLLSRGNNLYGSLGIGEEYSSFPDFRSVNNINRTKDISAGSNSCIAIDEDNNVWTWGMNFSGQLGIGNMDIEYVTSPVKVAFTNNKNNTFIAKKREPLYINGILVWQ